MSASWHRPLKGRARSRRNWPGSALSNTSWRLQKGANGARYAGPSIWSANSHLIEAGVMASLHPAAIAAMPGIAAAMRRDHDARRSSWALHLWRPAMTTRSRRAAASIIWYAPASCRIRIRFPARTAAISGEVRATVGTIMITTWGMPQSTTKMSSLSVRSATAREGGSAASSSLPCLTCAPVLMPKRQTKRPTARKVTQCHGIGMVSGAVAPVALNIGARGI